MSFYKEVPGRQTTLESTLKFDTAPTAGSTNPVTSDGVNSAVADALDAVPEIIDNTPNIKNVQSDWNQTDNTADDFIKNKPYYTNNTQSTYFKVCSFLKTGADGQQSDGLEILARYFQGAVHGKLLYKAGFALYYEKVGNVSTNNQYFKFHWKENGDIIDIYAQRTGYSILHVAPLVNQPKYNVDFTNFGTAVTSLPEGATEIIPVWEANSANSSGTSPVKVDAYGALTPVPMDDVPTEGSKNLMTSGAIKAALDQLSARIAALE